MKNLLAILVESLVWGKQNSIEMTSFLVVFPAVASGAGHK